MRSLLHAGLLLVSGLVVSLSSAGELLADLKPVLDGTWIVNRDFAGADLEGQRLVGDFTGANFQGASLEGADLAAIFDDADFTGAVIRNASISSLGLTQSQFYSTASYQSGDLRGIEFESSAIGFVILGRGVIAEWDFSGQDLRGADFTVASAERTDFRNANLDDASLRGAVLDDAMFSGASMNGIELFYGEIRGVDLANASLIGADLRGMDVNGAIMHGADLQNASVRLLTDFDASMFDANTRYNDRTEFPAGFDPVSAGLTKIDTLEGDFNADQRLDEKDIDLLIARLLRGPDANAAFLEGDRIYNNESRSGYYTFDTPQDAELLLIGLNERKNDGWLEPMWDVDANSRVSYSDLRHWVSEVKRTWIGDANLDGVFDSGDLVSVFRASEYEDGIRSNSSWETGDWNGDGEFSTADLTFALSDGGYDQGLRPGAAAVPEPVGLLGILAPALLILRIGRTPRLVAPRG